jgi:type II secretory pathway predicted ATPase ExeA
MGTIRASYLISTCQNVSFQSASKSPLFSPSSLSGVHDHTKGVARRINNFCRSVLLLGATEGKQILDETHLKRIILDLEGQIG